MKFLGVSGVFDYAGLKQGARAIAPVHVAFRTYQGRRPPDCQFTELNTHPPILCLRFTECPAVPRASLEAERIATPFP
jgi:hypothetical protein